MLRIGLVATCALIASCGGSAKGPGSPADAKESAAADRTRCGVLKGEETTRVEALPPAERAALLDASKRGRVAVERVGCTLRILPRCSADGTYAFTGSAPAEERISLTDEASLYREVPAGAASLKGKTPLDLHATSIGAWQTSASAAKYGDLTGECEDATHVVTMIRVGAFAIAPQSAGAPAPAASATTPPPALASDGDLTACTAAQPGAAPPPTCGAALSVTVSPIVDDLPAGPSVPGAPSEGYQHAKHIFDQEKFAEALPLLRRVVHGATKDDAGNRQTAQHYEGVALYYLGRYEEARAVFAKIAASPSHVKHAQAATWLQKVDQKLTAR